MLTTLGGRPETEPEPELSVGTLRVDAFRAGGGGGGTSFDGVAGGWLWCNGEWWDDGLVGVGKGDRSGGSVSSWCS